jgi:serine/threonine protein kinase
MALSSVSELGRYEIQSAYGAGGMGEVYRARDTRLERVVAIKIRSVHLSESSELKARFEREARAISSLNHPPICHLYDVGSLVSQRVASSGTGSRMTLCNPHRLWNSRYEE